jgi:hypothetical protein
LKLEFSATFSRLGEELRTMKASKFTEAQKAFILMQGEEGKLLSAAKTAGCGAEAWHPRPQSRTSH